MEDNTGNPMDDSSDLPEGLAEDQLEDVIETDDEEEEEDEQEDDDDEGTPADGPASTYLPTKPLEDGEELVCDETAYIMLHQAQTGEPCLSFDIIPDGLGLDRSDFPQTCYVIAGTQAGRSFTNKLIVMKMSNLHKTNPDDAKDESSDEESEDEEENKPDLDCAVIFHQGTVNRVRMRVVGEKPLAASWSETGKVHIWDLSRPLQAVNESASLAAYVNNKESPQPLYTFRGHGIEGYALDWSTTEPGVLATGDCRKGIHIWRPSETSWTVDQRPLIGHTASVEDIQWSPNESNVLASCSVDGSIRIWDTRIAPHKACMLAAERAHESDVNVLHWNRSEPFLASGGDDGRLCVWDLRTFQSGSAIAPVAVFKHHTGPVCTVAWHPTEHSVLASGGEDDQIALWDLAVEKDAENEEEDEELKDLPPQLLFIHQGQKEIKELHWHPQIPGTIISTAASGFNVFKTISV